MWMMGWMVVMMNQVREIIFGILYMSGLVI